MRRREESEIFSSVSGVRGTASSIFNHSDRDVVDPADGSRHFHGGPAGEDVALGDFAAGVGTVWALCHRHHGGSAARDSLRRDGHRAASDARQLQTESAETFTHGGGLRNEKSPALLDLPLHGAKQPQIRCSSPQSRCLELRGCIHPSVHLETFNIVNRDFSLKEESS